MAENPQKSLTEGAVPGDRKESQRLGSSEPIPFLTIHSLILGVLVSMGGFIFGFDTGQISGIVAMKDFLERFGNSDSSFSNAREGTIVALLSIGTLVGALLSAVVADALGRKLSMTVWCGVFCVGVIIQISAETVWQQVAVGRLVAGLGVGALSVLVPMYQSESGPRHIRGALVSAYQLFITFGIFLAYVVNYGTESMQSSASWRIPIGLSFLWALILAVGMIFLPESPRYAYRHGRVDEAAQTMSKLYGVPVHHRAIRRELREIKEQLDSERTGPWYEVFTGPRMAYRTLLGITLQALQQLTGANFFFYYGTTVFQAIGLSNSYITQMILGGINFGMTFFGLYVVEHYGRRRALIAGALWMFMCFMVFASVGHFILQSMATDTPKAHTAGIVMIVFAALFIAGYAVTWGPIVWCIVGELYPSRYRAKSMALATSSNWTWNFLISFFTPFITSAIDYRYGYIFAAGCFAGALVVYFFVCEGSGKTLEEIDRMYLSHVKPRHSTKWEPAEDKEAEAAS
ncbi:hexose transporter hxt1 [Agyrium rufum]|nr:hexose transporter hxt1 [Agyrium rufum]